MEGYLVQQDIVPSTLPPIPHCLTENNTPAPKLIHYGERNGGGHLRISGGELINLLQQENWNNWETDHFGGTTKFDTPLKLRSIQKYWQYIGVYRDFNCYALQVQNTKCSSCQ